jgi:hypothetical protein
VVWSSLPSFAPSLPSLSRPHSLSPRRFRPPTPSPSRFRPCISSASCRRSSSFPPLHLLCVVSSLLLLVSLPSTSCGSSLSFPFPLWSNPPRYRPSLPSLSRMPPGVIEPVGLSSNPLSNPSGRYRTPRGVVESVWPSSNPLAVFEADRHSVGVFLWFRDVVSSWRRG